MKLAVSERFGFMPYFLRPATASIKKRSVISIGIMGFLSPALCVRRSRNESFDGVSKLKNFCRFFLLFVLILGIFTLPAAASKIAEIEVSNVHDLERSAEWVIVSLQLPGGVLEDHCVLIDYTNQDTVYAQIFGRKADPLNQIENCYLIAPVDLGPQETRRFFLHTGDQRQKVPENDLTISGAGLDLIVENRFYRADLRQNENEAGQKFRSGQLNRLTIKSHDNMILKRKSNRMHWAPNFRRSGDEDYTTIAHWDPPDVSLLDIGPYLIRLLREGSAPEFPEIRLTAVYYFFAGVPYFRFYSEMEIQQDISLSLLRNDEMTMDSLFTHVAFCRPDGRIEDYPFIIREQILQSDPIANSDPWLCFYHREQGYAFGSIRIQYDVVNRHGLPSPTYSPHTKISNGAGGGKYWNRRLIHEKDTFVPAGSRYCEENAYLIFDIGESDRFETITYWQNRLRQPVRVHVRYIENNADN